MASPPVVWWVRADLRLADNPALLAAVETGAAVVPVFVWAPEEEAPWAPGAASRWWLHHSLAAIDAALRARGSRLVLRRGPSARALRDVATASNAGAVVWGRRYEPVIAARDDRVAAELRAAGLDAVRTGGSLLVEPEAVRTQAGQPFQVFTPFWKSCLAFPAVAPARSAPRTIRAPSAWPASLALGELDLLPRPDWAGGLAERWTPGERGARDALRRFLRTAADAYPERRDIPGERGTSSLSPHLHFGEISPRQVWHAAAGAPAFVRQVGWREFAHHLLHHFPATPSEPLRPQFARFPWRRDPAALRAWQRGRTGYPIVDAGMRELWRTGWMHNRVRMVAASVLVKHLLLPWQEGAAWFWDTLVDADLANNTLGWQWVAGCGADAAPYFRVFNPALQGRKFDPTGAYVRHWVPELAGLPDRLVHAPWEATPIELAAAGVTLGETYPEPIVAHDVARDRALAAYQTIRAR